MPDSKTLVIVESPTKARTLSRFLGNKYHIEASYGHVRDLPKSEFGVDVEKNFEPRYVIPRDKRSRVSTLKKAAKGVKTLYLATDPDREGEAIAWHLQNILSDVGEHKIYRVAFHEITKEAVDYSFAHPEELNMNLVDAQQARRILDRLVGYELSPLLWEKVRRGLSAGRVQSVALRLIVEREREIEKFKAIEYWTIDALLQKPGDTKTQFSASLTQKSGKKISASNKEEANKVLADIQKSDWVVSDVVKKETRQHPKPPFTTSTLQQAASNRLGFSTKKTMQLAQNLYEEGLITYMRTDSFNLASSAVDAARDFIGKSYGSEYMPDKANAYKSKSKVIQEAHEAIRPTSPAVATIDGPTPDHIKLYTLIWQRMISSQMTPAVLEQTAVDVAAGEYIFHSAGSVVVFDGWARVYGSSKVLTESVLPSLDKGEKLEALKVDGNQHFTEPPPRFTEASLVKELEKYGIGRPSTYAPTISTILDRRYIEREDRKLQPTNLGISVNDFVVGNFKDIMDYSFTAEMENELDEIAAGQRKWQPMMKEFWGPFKEHVNKVGETAERIKIEVETTDEVCEKCGKPMIIREGRFGKFMACSGFPECKNTKSVAVKTGIVCPDDGGDVILKRTKKGRPFYGCSNYPNCKYASWTKPVIKGEELVEKPAEPEQSIQDQS